MSSYEQVLICSPHKLVRDVLTTYSSIVRNTYKNKLFETLIRVLIYANQEKLQNQYDFVFVIPLFFAFEKAILINMSKHCSLLYVYSTILVITLSP